jgi:hypothetical protein
VGFGVWSMKRRDMGTTKMSYKLLDRVDNVNEMTLRDAREACGDYGFADLITSPDANSKLAKSEGYRNIGVSLTPSTVGVLDNCPNSTPKCRAACLAFTGRIEMESGKGGVITRSRLGRTKLLADNPRLFADVLYTQLLREERKAKRDGVNVAFRPDVLSDRFWHLENPWIFEAFPSWEIYGYTKSALKVQQFTDGELPKNYHITFSWSELANPLYCRTILESGVNVAVPFYDRQTLKGCLSDSFLGFPVIDGDKSDLRFLDPSGVIVGLRAKLPKLRARANKRVLGSSGFFVGV